MVLLSIACRGVPVAPVPDLVFTDEHNYRCDSSVALESVEVAAETDVCFDWSALALTEPATRVFVASYNVAVADLEHALVERTALLAVPAPLFARVPAGDTQGCLEALDFEGDPVQPSQLREDPIRTWVFSVAVGTCGVLSPSVVVRPSEVSSNHEVTLTDTSSVLTQAPDLTVGEPLAAVAGTHPLLDWSGLLQAAAGGAFVQGLHDRLRIARFDETDPTALGDAVLDLEATADELYTLEVYGMMTHASLAQAHDRYGDAFGGFTTSGTWLVAIDSFGCDRWAPRAVALVSVAP